MASKNKKRQEEDEEVEIPLEEFKEKVEKLFELKYCTTIKDQGIEEDVLDAFKIAPAIEFVEWWATKMNLVSIKDI